MKVFPPRVVTGRHRNDLFWSVRQASKYTYITVYRKAKLSHGKGPRSINDTFRGQQPSCACP